MRKNEKGSSAVVGLLLLFVIGIIGLVGWYVWQSSHKTVPAVTNVTPSTSQKSLKPIPTTQLSDFKIPDLDATLSFPTEWGTAAMTDGPLSKFQTGAYKQLSFSKATNITINFVNGAYASPLDGCGLEDPVLNAQHAQNGTQASVIGWEGRSLKRYMTGQGFDKPTIYKVSMTPGDSGPGWTEVATSEPVLEYKDIDNRVRATTNSEGCGAVTQSQADAANAFLNIYHFAVNYSNKKVVGINAQYDARKGDEAMVRNQLVGVLKSVK